MIYKQDLPGYFLHFKLTLCTTLYTKLMHVRRPPPRKIIVNVSVIDDVQLKKSENAWKPGMKRESVPEDPDALKTQV